MGGKSSKNKNKFTSLKDERVAAATKWDIDYSPAHRTYRDPFLNDPRNEPEEPGYCDRVSTCLKYTATALVFGGLGFGAAWVLYTNPFHKNHSDPASQPNNSTLPFHPGNATFCLTQNGTFACGPLFISNDANFILEKVSLAEKINMDLLSPVNFIYKQDGINAPIVYTSENQLENKPVKTEMTALEKLQEKRKLLRNPQAPAKESGYAKNNLFAKENNLNKLRKTIQNDHQKKLNFR